MFAIGEAYALEGVSKAKCAEFVGISRATYYRRRARHKALARGVLPPSKAPKRRNKPHWGEREKQLVLDVRRTHPTWGKAKIAVVIQREHGHDISESMVGRILSFLSQKHQITPARSRPQKRRRDFSKGHAEAWKYKEYNKIELGERVQIDHMSATKKRGQRQAFHGLGPQVKTHPRADIFQCQGHIRPKILARIGANRPVCHSINSSGWGIGVHGRI